MEILDFDLSVSIHLSEVTEETLETGRREHLEDAASTRDHTPLRVRHPSGAEDQVTRPCLELGATDREDVLTLKNVKMLIVILTPLTSAPISMWSAWSPLLLTQRLCCG
jgi:predicted nucleotidyltransferase component of viral defense system